MDGADKVAKLGNWKVGGYYQIALIVREYHI
jgi:hypothetical protein